LYFDITDNQSQNQRGLHVQIKGGNKVKRILAFVALIVFVSFMTVSFNGPALAAQAKTTMVQGVLENVDGQYVIKSKKGSVAVTGQEFSEMTGKMVQASGKMTSGPDGGVLKVTTIKELKKTKK
jgi:hypothetical protein